MAKSGNEKKYEQVYASLRQLIADSTLRPGERLPTERELVSEFGVSRPTVTRALNDLAADGLIQRRTGSGSYVLGPPDEQATKEATFGLLVPGLGKGEIFEPICARIASRSEQENFELVWGHFGGGDSHTARAELLRAAERYIERDVDGVFFEPVELRSDATAANAAVVELLESSGVPIVLLDGDYVPFPERSPYDIVGIDNTRAAYIATKHLIDQGAERVDFLWRPYTATTYQRRLAGYRAALTEAGIAPSREWEHPMNPEDDGSVRRLAESGATDIVCVNDESAAILMRGLEGLSLHVPRDVRVVGFDDVKYAWLARVPLTTIRQPCDAIGDLAVQAMFSRLRYPQQPARDLLLEGELMVRTSSLRA